MKRPWSSLQILFCLWCDLDTVLNLLRCDTLCFSLIYSINNERKKVNKKNHGNYEHKLVDLFFCSFILQGNLSTFIFSWNKFAKKYILDRTLMKITTPFSSFSTISLSIYKNKMWFDKVTLVFVQWWWSTLWKKGWLNTAPVEQRRRKFQKG